MALKDILKNAPKTLAIAGLALGGYLLPTQAKAADATVNPSMNHTTINSTINSRVAGETVFFECGTYNLPPDPNAFYQLNVDGVNLTKAPSCLANEEAILKANTSLNSPIIFVATSIDNTISNVTFEGNNNGFAVALNSSFDPARPVNITNNEFRNLEQAITWRNHTVIGDNSLPSVKITGNTFNNVKKGNRYDQIGSPNDTQTAWALVANNTGISINAIFFEPPKLLNSLQGSVASGFQALGVAQFDGNILINSNGVTMPSDVLPVSFQGSVASTLPVPERNGEHEVALNPDPSYAFAGYLADLYPGAGNFTTDPQFTTHLRPLPGPAAPGDGTWSGGRPPAGDVNGDGLVNGTDELVFRDILETGRSMTTNEWQSFDLNFTPAGYGDGVVDNQDIAPFCAIYDAYNGAGACGLWTVVPAVSTWGLVALALTTLSAGTVILSRRRAG